jgi:indole-3-glycerol phosphate synthase
MESLVEVTDKEEVKLAISAGAKLIGINNRDLETLNVDLNRTVKLAPSIPDDVTLVSESGINTPADVRRMLDAGADAVLIGTALMQANDIEQKVRSLVNAR